MCEYKRDYDNIFLILENDSHFKLLGYFKDKMISYFKNENIPEPKIGQLKRFPKDYQLDFLNLLKLFSH
mgnify:CR=1 FL=1